MRRAIESALLALALCGPAAALEITAVSPAAVKGAAKADFTFASFTLKGVSFSGGAVVLPATEYKGRTYQDVKILSKALYTKLETCFKGGCRPAKAAAPKLSIAGFKPLKSRVRVANAELVFDGELSVTAGVMVSSREPGTFWVSFPPELAFPDAAFKSAAETAVIAAWVKNKAK